MQAYPPPMYSAFHKTLDFFYSWFPQRHPGPDKVKSCKLIAHRGVFDNVEVFENTLAAFDAAVEKGVWGIEFDVRWTRDEYPVIIHDACAQEIFKKDLLISNISLHQVRTHLPLVPSLEDVVKRYGKKVHLMIELKCDWKPLNARQIERLKETLAPLKAVNDYHFLALKPMAFENLDFVPPKTLLPVAQANVKQLSEFALNKQLGGITGHYLLLSKSLQRRHREAGQKIGTGFAASRNSLWRELNRDVEWIFTNKAAELVEVIKKESQAK